MTRRAVIFHGTGDQPYETFELLARLVN